MSWNHWKKRALKAEAELKEHASDLRELKPLRARYDAAHEALYLLLHLNPGLSRHRIPIGRIEKWDLEGMRKAAAYEDTLAAYEKHGPDKSTDA